jgi:pimeloyl-ACP methyl ester carboxylesterase
MPLTVLPTTIREFKGNVTLGQGRDDLPGAEYDGIVCDNSTAVQDNSLRIRPNVATRQAWGWICDANGNVQNDTDKGQLGRLQSLGEGLWYYPPLEYGSLRRSVRTIHVKMQFEDQSGRWFVTKPIPIVLARPVATLVHGINSSANSWVQLVKAHENRPWLLFDYWKLQEANGPVEEAASMLQGAIASTVSSLRRGTYSQSYLFTYGLFSYLYAFDDYVGKRLSARRVDVVAWSYGGVVARWYMGATGPSPTGNASTEMSTSWYKREDADWWGIPSWIEYRRKLDEFLTLNPIRYGSDVRKLVTLGSMWNGVPLCNWTNEVLSVGGRREPDLGGELLRDYVYGASDLGLGLPPTRVAAFEVMAVGSRWRTWPTFQDTVQYFAIAGDDNNYLPGGGDVHKVVTLLADSLDRPGWFPYLLLEVRNGGTRGLSDGLVPLWSQQIPGASAIFGVDHNDYPNAPEVRAELLKRLDDPNLRSGRTLKEIFQGQPAWVESRPYEGSTVRWRWGVPELQGNMYGGGRIGNEYYIKQKDLWRIEAGPSGTYNVVWGPENLIPFSRVEVTLNARRLGTVPVSDGTFRLKGLLKGLNTVTLRWIYEQKGWNTDRIEVKFDVEASKSFYP